MNLTIPIQKDATYHTLDFSICTIVNDMEEYEVMKNTFVEKGFTDSCEYIIADNCNGNQFDAYQAISHFLKIAKGEYLIVVHQDVRLIDDRSKLNFCLTDLQEKDSNWAICGNASVIGYYEPILHITHETHADFAEGLPKKVKSLDENLLIIKASSNITISANLRGFHLYGTDLCILANMLGYNSYVIEFMVLHLSKGNVTSLKQQQHEFVEKYGEKMKIGYIRTTCTQLFLSNSGFKNKILNSSPIFSLIKLSFRLSFLFKIWAKWGRRKKRSLLKFFDKEGKK